MKEFEKYYPKGKMIFSIKGECVKFQQIENSEYFEDVLKMYPDFVPENSIYHHMSGKEFYDAVHDGYFIDYDGSIAEIYVNGYESNLGLIYNGICQGGLLLDGDTWLQYCKDFDIIVNWANR